MRAAAIALSALVLSLGAVAAAPAAVAQPDLPPDVGEGCSEFHWHEGDVLGSGELPHYHYHMCY